MKNRSLFIGLCAFLAATVSAVAATLLPNPVPAYVRIKSTTNQLPHCVLTNATCDTEGQATCKVTVQGFTGFGRDLTGSNVCPVTTNVNDQPIGTTLTTEEVITAIDPIE